MGGTTGCDLARGSESLKAILSSDRRLQLACVKSELLVTAGQHTAVNMFSGLVHTARQTTRVWCTRSRFAEPQGQRCRRCARRGGLSRNKVAVPEGVAGSPPFKELRLGFGSVRRSAQIPQIRRSQNREE
jgi:hypothetical protein